MQDRKASPVQYRGEKQQPNHSNSTYGKKKNSSLASQAQCREQITRILAQSRQAQPSPV